MNTATCIAECEEMSNICCNQLQKKIVDLDAWHESLEKSKALINKLSEEIQAHRQKLQAHYEKGKTEIDHLQKSLEEKLSEKNKLQDELNSIEALKEELNTVYDNLENKCTKIKSQIEISPHDKRVLDIAQKKYDVFKKITNVVFDYTVPTDVAVVGCVRNKATGYIRPFEIQKKELTVSERANKLWSEAEAATEVWSDIFEDGENTDISNYK